MPRRRPQQACKTSRSERTTLRAPQKLADIGGIIARARAPLPVRTAALTPTGPSSSSYFLATTGVIAAVEAAVTPTVATGGSRSDSRDRNACGRRCDPRERQRHVVHGKGAVICSGRYLGTCSGNKKSCNWQECDRAYDASRPVSPFWATVPRRAMSTPPTRTAVTCVSSFPTCPTSECSWQT